MERGAGLESRLAWRKVLDYIASQTTVAFPVVHFLRLCKLSGVDCGGLAIKEIYG